MDIKKDDIHKKIIIQEWRLLKAKFEARNPKQVYFAWHLFFPPTIILPGVKDNFII